MYSDTDKSSLLNVTKIIQNILLVVELISSIALSDQNILQKINKLEI